MESPKNNRIADIARMAGVSVGTVDRVIHNRGRVSEESLRRVQAVLKDMDYHPNMIARSLASRKEYHIVAVIPEVCSGAYWETVDKGIERAAQQLGKYNLKIHKIYFDQYNRVSFLKVAEQLDSMSMDGVVIATLFTDPVKDLSARLDKKGIPYIYLDSNIQGQNQLAYFGTDSYCAGRIAARLLLDRMISNTNREFTDVLIAKVGHEGENDSTQVRARERGFCDYLADNNFVGDLKYVHLKVDDNAHNHRELDAVFMHGNHIGGAVTFNSTCYLLGEYLVMRNLDRVNLIGYDLISNNADLLTDMKALALIAQRPFFQGYMASMALGEYLIFDTRPAAVNLMPIDILIPENVIYYQNHSI